VPNLPPSTTVPPSAAPPLTGKLLLLVEDEDFIAELLIIWLAGLGAKILWAKNGQTGLALLASHGEKINLVIADFGLPDMNGGNLCAQLRAVQPRLPVLLTSGRYQREAEAHLALTGPTYFIQKPYSVHAILTKLLQLLAVT
jgi:CheY-like chemotaxis protein